MRKETKAQLLSLLLLAMLLAEQLPLRVALATPREDTPTYLLQEFLTVLRRVVFPDGVEEKDARGILDGIEVIRRAGGRDKLVEELKPYTGEELARKVVEKLEKQPERYFDRYFAKGGFRAYIEIKTETGNWDHVWKEAVQDAYLVPVLRARGAKEVVVWFIPSPIASGYSEVIKYLRSKGVVVITTTEVNSVLVTMHEAYVSWFGADLIDAWADWMSTKYQLKDPQARAKLRQALYDGSIFNFIPPEEVGLTRRQRSLDEFERALRGFAEDAGQAAKLRDFVRKNWGTLSLVGGFAVKVVFDMYTRLNPPKTPEEERTRRIVGMAIDMTNLGIAALMDFENALVFVRSLRAAAAGAGETATATAAAAGISLVMSALSWYAGWYVETHTTYTLCRVVGGYEICFNIEKPPVAYAILPPYRLENLTITMSGIKVASFPLYRTLGSACITDDYWLKAVDRSASFGPVSITCKNALSTAECTVEAISWSYISEPRTYDYGYYVQRCVADTQITYRWTWRVRIGPLGLEEVQAPLGWPVSYKWLGERCITYYLRTNQVQTQQSYTPPTSSPSVGALPQYWRRYEPEPR